MTGPEHYAEAERLAAMSATSPDSEAAMWAVRAAQAHATLALVAATVEAAFDPEGRHLALAWGLS